MTIVEPAEGPINVFQSTGFGQRRMLTLAWPANAGTMLSHCEIQVDGRVPNGLQIMIEDTILRSRTSKLVRLLELLFFTISISQIGSTALASTSKRAIWSPLGAGFDRPVRVLTDFGGQLVAGGEFYSTSEGEPMMHISAWNGRFWSLFGGGLPDDALALASYDGHIVVGGNFVVFPFSGIVALNGESWLPFDTGMDNKIVALTVYNGELIAGGTFSEAGGMSANKIAAWDGTSWSPLGTGVDHTAGSICCLGTFEGKLVAGGMFTSVDSVATNNIASWDGTSWSTLGAGLGHEWGWEVAALAVFRGQLIAGGAFNFTGDNQIAVNNIASWDGTTWSALGAGTNNTVTALTVFDGKLIVGGYFTTAGGDSAFGISTWDGSDWVPLGSGIGPPGPWTTVSSLASYNQLLVVAGNFGTAGGTPSHNIAVWKKCVCGDVDGNDFISISDVVYLISYIFGGGAAPIPLLVGDVNSSGTVSISDAVYLIRFVFSGGPAPCEG